MSKDSGKSSGKGSDSSPAIIPGKGTNTAANGPLPDWQAPATRGGGWFGGKK